MLIVFGGLPGVGKTTLSAAVARRLGAVYLRVDAIESAMWDGGIDRDQPTGFAAYGVAEAIAAANLRMGATVLADAVNPVEAARAGWREVAAEVDVPLRVVEVVCSDQAEHRRRVEARRPGPGQRFVPTWAQVATREYEPWTEPRLTVDTVTAADVLVERIVSYVSP
jgi:predicted kinase